jgi:hypothetical protein
MSRQPAPCTTAAFCCKSPRNCSRTCKASLRLEGAQKEAVLAEANLSGSIEGRFLSELDSAPDLLRALVMSCATMMQPTITGLLFRDSVNGVSEHRKDRSPGKP